ncbi:hypothetical protein [Natronorarus salvus]|uniref:hypothetical protein n=1 Tax=Natronorarus salvus TaxID=3117733 RepID=UPI002F268131
MVASRTVRWLRGLWEYYRGYTKTAVHTAAGAALAVFGLLIFVDPLFAAVAIVSYVLPPVVLYVLDADVGRESSFTGPSRQRTDPGGTSIRDSDGDTDSHNGDTDSDSDGGNG